jgi:hypothetical protein
VENVSNEAVYIQGGDILKGGQQDRVISNDFVLPSKALALCGLRQVDPAQQCPQFLCRDLPPTLVAALVTRRR